MKRNQSCFSSLGVLFLVFSILFLGSVTGFSSQNEKTFVEMEGKIYIAPGCVYVAPNGIFINNNGELLEVDSLYADAGGIYVLRYTLSPEAGLNWTCPYCKHSNPFWANQCQNPKCSTSQ